MLELHTRQVHTVDATAIKRARKNEKDFNTKRERLLVVRYERRSKSFFCVCGGGVGVRVFFIRFSMVCLSFIRVMS